MISKKKVFISNLNYFAQFKNFVLQGSLFSVHKKFYLSKYFLSLPEKFSFFLNFWDLRGKEPLPQARTTMYASLKYTHLVASSFLRSSPLIIE